MKIKKILKIGLTVACCLIISACQFGNNSLENANIYTTTYPINYLVKTLYGSHALNISSIYPSDCDITTYEIPEKNNKEFASADLFVYNGLTNEKDIAKNLVNINRDLLIIDVSYGLTLTNEVNELWLSPNNYLMLAKNIKDNLIEYVNNKSIKEDIEEKYTSFEENISLLDAALHNIGKSTDQTIVVSSNGLKFLENYGFNIISLKDENNLKEIKLNNIKNNFKNKKYKYLIVADNDNNDELVKEITDNYKPEIISINTMTLSLEDDYFNVINEFIENLKNISNQ